MQYTARAFLLAVLYWNKAGRDYSRYSLFKLIGS